MEIHNNFQGGNIIVKEIKNDTAFLSQDMRDSDGSWFYWAFCVENAHGKALHFTFKNNLIGYYGPAISHDLISWEWLGKRTGENSFEYTFKEDEDKVYFAHHMLYTQNRFSLLEKELGFNTSELCKSQSGKSVPCIRLGGGSKKIILTSRHHACESTGTYVLEGVIRELFETDLSEDLEFLIVPFVDYDGVIKGDQGKNRIPHDHNRDYCQDMLYNETKAIFNYVLKNGVYVGVDFHSPYHLGGINDCIFMVRNNPKKSSEFDRLGALFEKECSFDTMNYKVKNDFPPNFDWNWDSQCSFGNTLNKRSECRLAFSLETTYFGRADNKVSIEKLINTGRAFAKALIKYAH